MTDLRAEDAERVKRQARDDALEDAATLCDRYAAAYEDEPTLPSWEGEKLARVLDGAAKGIRAMKAQ